LCNKVGDRLVWVGDAHVDQSGFISSLHDFDFIGAEGTVSNQFLDRHSRSPIGKTKVESGMFEHPKSNQQYSATFILSSVCRILNIADHASYARAATAIKKRLPPGQGTALK